MGKIYKKSGQGRRTGVGITAEGDMLAAMGLRYGTEEATEFLNKYIKQSLWKPIVHLLTWQKNVEHSLSMTVNEKNNPFINRLKEADPELYEEMKIRTT